MSASLRLSNRKFQGCLIKIVGEAAAAHRMRRLADTGLSVVDSGKGGATHLADDTGRRGPLTAINFFYNTRPKVPSLRCCRAAAPLRVD